MKKKSTLIMEGIGAVIFAIIGGLIFITLVAIPLSDLKDAYRNNYMDIPAWIDFFTFAMCALCVGILAWYTFYIINYISSWSGEKIEDHGEIVEILERKKGYTKVMVEFQNGLRLELYADKKMILTRGDSGFIGVQGKILVYLKKQN